jgi:anaerobic selenocysteine-containing dehydrogenase
MKPNIVREGISLLGFAPLNPTYVAINLIKENVMDDWHQTGCVLCAQNCGLKIKVENNRIVKVLPDKDNVRSEGYICRKGANVAFHQHHDQRLTHPLKRVGNKFEKISWAQAIKEIAEKLTGIVDEHGPKSFAYMGGGGQGMHMEAAFGVRLLRGMGSHYHYTALAQELTGHFWAHGRVLGHQSLFSRADEENTEMLVGVGWNGMHSHQIPQAPRKLRHMAKDPDKLLVIIDPRLSETAKIADIHLPVRPGTDALMTRAMIAIIIQEGWEDKDYIKDHVSGFDEIQSWFKDFDAKAAIEICQLDYNQVHNLCRLMITKKWSLHADLGTLMSRHSTVTSYLQLILLVICGRLCVPGGNIVPGCIMPISSHSDERNPKTWRTVETDFPAISGAFPPNVMPEEIMSDKPDRLRAVLVSGANPLRSYADTTEYEEAFKNLDLLVTIELAMTETAVLSHYILPARSGYEAWDTTFFAMTYPGVFFQIRRPIIKSESEALENGEIITLLADALGLIPKIPDSLYEAAKKSRMEFGMELMNFAGTEPKALATMPFILAKTLGPELGSTHLAALWVLLQTMPKDAAERAVRSGFKEGPGLGEEIFQKALDQPEGFWVGTCEGEDNMDVIRNEDGKFNVFIPEVENWVKSIEPAAEEKALDMNDEFPLVLCAGRHSNDVANTLMRDPSWNEGRRSCTMCMHPESAEKLNISDGQMVKIITEAGQEEIELEVTDKVRVGQVLIPHGFGMVYKDKVYGTNVNRLTKNTHRDRFAATPLHRYVPCRVEAI